MFAAVRKAANAQMKTASAVQHGMKEDSTQSLPESYSLTQLHNELCRSDEDSLLSLMILGSCLAAPERLLREDGDEEYITKISLWVSEMIRPNGDCVLENHSSEDERPSKILATALQKGILGLESLRNLIQMSTARVDAKVLIAILAFTSEKDDWTTPKSVSVAESILALCSIQRQTSAPDFVRQTLLHDFIRPLFSASKPESITNSGRKAMPSSAPPKRHDFTNEKAQQPWRYEAPHSIAVLEWAVKNASSETLSTSWPLLTPPLLTLLDTPSAPFLVRGLNLTEAFLPRLPNPARLLAQTGLSSVFEDAILPTTLYLPSITPLADTLLILPAAHSALFALYSARFETTTARSPDPEPENTKNTAKEKEKAKEKAETEKSRLHFLSRLLRKGILAPSFHASSHPAIITVLLAHLAPLLQRLGVHAVKHLKDILPLLSSVLTDPFGGARLAGLMQALKTLQVLILNCWPRLGEPVWRREVVRMLVLCWRTAGESGLDGDDPALMRGVREEVKVAGRLLVKAVEGTVNMSEELGPLVEVDGEVMDIFGFEVAG